MPRLSWPIENIKRHYEVVVVGSGYGGAIAASRLARAGRQVCLLERGREWQPGEYPDTLREAWSQMQVDSPRGRFGSLTGLYDLRMNDEMAVFLGCGLGGTSLVNAGVMLEPDIQVFKDERWPSALSHPGALDDGFRRAREMLRPSPYPPSFPPLPKLTALEKSSEFLARQGHTLDFYRPPINVNFQDQINHVGVNQLACKLCGDCMTGCNYAAKNTLIMNYLPDARNHGAEIYTRTWVERVEQQDGRWLVHFQVLDSGREVFDAPSLFVRADVVVLGAGCLGSTEILLRSANEGLQLSDKVGSRFTGNGDVLGFGYNTDDRIDGIGYGPHPADPNEPVGPTITGVIDLRKTPRLEDGFVIEEGSLPGALSGFLPEVFSALSLLEGDDTDRGFLDFIRERAREWGGLFRGRHSGALRNTQTYLVMAHDDGQGVMQLDGGRLRIHWQGVGDQPIFRTINARLREATAALGGTYDEDPLWSRLFNHSLVTVHPLGGCVMAEDASEGVVNERGQVFSGATGIATYRDLYVLDGSIIPRPLGVNPLMTISAVAERCVALLASDRGWQFGYEFQPVKTEAEAPRRVGIEFTETMRGAFSTSVANPSDDIPKADYERAFKEGVEAARDATEAARAEHRRPRMGDYRGGGPFEFTVTISSPDLDLMLKDPHRGAAMIGTVRAPSLSDDPLLVTNGKFNLLVDDPETPRAREMRYRMELTATDGSSYVLQGFKTIRDDPGFDVWADTTTLYVTIWRGPSVPDADKASGTVVGHGILRIRAKDFMRQLTTMRAPGARSLSEALAAKTKFGLYFAGELREVYGPLMM